MTLGHRASFGSRETPTRWSAEAQSAGKYMDVPAMEDGEPPQQVGSDIVQSFGDDAVWSS
jgi:hypothetical protein